MTTTTMTTPFERVVRASLIWNAQRSRSDVAPHELADAYARVKDAALELAAEVQR